MSELTDRLRGVVRSSPVPRDVAYEPLDTRSIDADAVDPDSVDPGSVDAGSVDPDRRPRGVAADAAAILGGAWQESGGQRFATIDRAYAPGHRHGRVAVADGLPPEGGWPRLSLLAGAACGERLLFVDLETTGLAGGAGTHAFLVGCAWFEAGRFRIRQFLLTTLAAERAMLEAVAELAARTDAVVTYNGKTFDLPLIETRFLFQRMETPFGGMPHLDMLHVARRLWRQDEAEGEGLVESGPPAGSGCRLSDLERTLCGHDREGDVPGFEIPSRYFRYVRTGDARPLAGVLEHNRLDLLSLALLTARAAQLMDAGSAGAQTVREALGVGRLFERAGLTSDARTAFARAAGLEGDCAGAADLPASGDVLTRAEALRAYAGLARRERRHDDAALAWRRALDLPRCPAPISREATEALAVHHEHRLREPVVARAFALRSLECQGSVAGRRAVQHRLARLSRKIGEPTPVPQPLWPS